MSYYNKAKNIKFSSYSCVKAAKEFGVNLDKNENRKFNNYIQTITNSSRYLTEKVEDGFDTYFFGVLIHRRIDKNRYDIYCSSKMYAYYVIKKFRMIAHDEYEKIYEIISNDWEKIRGVFVSLPPKEKYEMQVNFERNFRLVVINQLSEIIDDSIRNAFTATNSTYISALMGEIVNIIIENKVQELFDSVTDEKLMAFMDTYESGLNDAKKYESAFLAKFLSYWMNRYYIEDDDKTASKIKSLFGKMLNKQLTEKISQAHIMEKSVVSILKTKEKEISDVLQYIDQTAHSVEGITPNYNKKHLAVIALILNKYVFPFIGEKNINFYHREHKFYESIERKLIVS